MKLSLQKRIQLSFLLSIALVAGIGAISFYYINLLNNEVQGIVEDDIALSHSGEKIKSELYSLRRVERVYIIDPESPLFHENMQTAIDQFRTTVGEGLKLCVRADTKLLHESILGSLDNYNNVIRGTTPPFNPRELAAKLDVPLRQINAAVSEIVTLRYDDLEAHRRQAQVISNTSNRNMILMVVTTILAGILVGLFAPSKVILPFRKLFAAIQEVQSANFNVSVSISGDDEIAELGHEFNKMVEELRDFDDMKIKKIAFEKRKLDALANMIDAGVVVLTVEGQIIYMNRSLYEILGVTSERILRMNVEESSLPKGLKELFLESIDRKDRFEDRKWTFSYETEMKEPITQTVRVSWAPVRNHVGDIVNFVAILKEMNGTAARTDAAEAQIDKVSDLGDTW